MELARNLALQNKKQPPEKCVALIDIGCKSAEPDDLLLTCNVLAMTALRSGELTTVERHWARLRPN